jgi:hypothetical protein
MGPAVSDDPQAPIFGAYHMTHKAIFFAVLALFVPATAAAQTFQDDPRPGIRLVDENASAVHDDVTPLPRLDPSPMLRMIEDLAQRPTAFPADTAGIQLCRLADDGQLDWRFRDALSDLCERHDVVALPKSSTSSGTNVQILNACSAFGEIGRSC